MKNKKLRYLILTVTILSALLSLIYWCANRQSPFRTFCDSMFLEELSGDTLGLHFTLAWPENFDIDTKDASLPQYSKEGALADYQHTQSYLDTLHTFDPTDLSAIESYTHELLSKSLSHELEGQKYYYLQEVFSPSSGTQIQFPILMAEYVFRCKKDIENYLSLLKQTPSYFSGLCEFEKEKFSRGFGMPDYSLDKVTEQCRTIVTAESLQTGEHFLITTFQERLNDAIDHKIITKKEADSYASLNKQYLTTYFLPAYESLASSLSALYGMGKNDNGLSYFKNGREYYEWLFQATTGSDVTIDNVYKALAQDYYASMLDLQKDLLSFQEKNTLTDKDLTYFPLTDSEKMLEDLKKQMSGDFPSVSSSFDVPALPATVKEVSPALEDYTAPAYYLIPPLDDNTQNSIYINNSSVPSGLELYTTLAHEGYPGHLYQTTYYQIYRKKQNHPYLRGILSYGGYVEGWALYTEFLSYDYAADLLVEDTGKEGYRLLYDIYRAQRRAYLSMLALLDVGIHYYGLDFERVKELLFAHGIADERTAREIFEYIVEEPGNYPKYYWGYLEILSLKDAAKEQMGEYYSDYSFHQFFLESGPSDFTTLTKKLTEE